MESLEKYNHKLFAIIGSVIVGGGILMLAGGMISGLFSVFSSRSHQQDGLHANSEGFIEGEQNENIITYFEPIQLDTAQAKYLTPIGFVSQEKEERSTFGSRSKYWKGASGVFSNFIYLNFNLDIRIQIFNEKIVISEWSFIKSDSTELLFFLGVNNDTNKDGEINAEDNKSLFVYYIQDKKLKTYSFSNKTVLNYKSLAKTRLVSITLGIDVDGNQEFESYKEPKEIKLLEINSQKVVDLVSPQMHKSISTLIE